MVERNHQKNRPAVGLLGRHNPYQRCYTQIKGPLPFLLQQILCGVMKTQIFGEQAGFDAKIQVMQNN